MSGYSYCLGQQAHETFARCDADQQVDLLLVFRGLAQRPFTTGLLEMRDETGRSHFVIAEAGLLIYYWPDHAVREVRISALRVV